jgi:hypothetical protein
LFTNLFILQLTYFKHIFLNGHPFQISCAKVNSLNEWPSMAQCGARFNPTNVGLTLVRHATHLGGGIDPNMEIHTMPWLNLSIN